MSWSWDLGSVQAAEEQRLWMQMGWWGDQAGQGLHRAGDQGVLLLLLPLLPGLSCFLCLTSAGQGL